MSESLGDRQCVRCGRGFYSELELIRFEEDPDYLPKPERFYVDRPDGWCCWDCLSLQEQRTEESQCVRCGAQFYDDGRDSDAGWIFPHEHELGVYLCPDCQTDEEARADAQRFVEIVERGKRRHGESHPDHDYLAALAENQRRWLERRERENADLNQRLGEEGDG